MAVSMPPLRAVFMQRTANALEIAEAGELARISLARGSRARALLRTTRLEALYEMAFLRVFVEWEVFLEEVFTRYLCGYVSTLGQATMISGKTYEKSLAAAESAILGAKPFSLWHNPVHVVARSQKFFHQCPIYTAIGSNSARISDMAAIRHRIAHGQDDAKVKFDAATMAFAGKRFRGSNAGAFLRDWDNSTAPPQRWLNRLSTELGSIAAQIG